MTDFSKTLFHCSSLSTIMSDGHGKSVADQLIDTQLLLEEEKVKFDAMKDKNSRSALKKEIKIDDLTKKIADLELRKDDVVLSDGCKVFLTGIYAYEKYGKWALPKGGKLYLPTEKGLAVESDGIALIAKLDGQVYLKNEKKYESAFICGIPDVILYEGTKISYIIDVKSSCDIETFFENLKKDLVAKYWWQMQGYFYLTGANKGEVSFCLLSSPPELIEKHIEHLKSIGSDHTEDEMRANLTFDDIPITERRLKFVVERDDTALSKIGGKIIKCREYLASLEQLHLNGFETTNGVPANNLLQDIPKQEE